MQAAVAVSPLEQLDEVIDGIVAEPVDTLADAALSDDLIALHRSLERLEAELIRRLQRFHQRKVAATCGVSTVSWLRSACRMTVKNAAHRVHLAQAFTAVPAALDSARHGRAPFCNAAMVARLAEDVGAEVVQPVAPHLVDAAEQFDPGSMRRLTEQSRLLLDPDGSLDAANRAHEQRWFSCDQTYGGVFVLRGELDAEGGMLVKTAIDALNPVPPPGDHRDASQRRADALVEMAAQQLQRGEHPTTHGERPHLSVTTSLDGLRQEPSLSLAELAGFGPVHREIARRIACDAVRRDTTVSAAPAVSGGVVPLSVGRSRRTIPPHLREALRLRDNGCRFPGCDRPHEWCDAHHIEHWADGGKTELHNLLSLCRLHHRVVHEEGWSITTRDGAVIIEPPPLRR
ncbi:MAG TPA: DUF222 domain-containing protein [Dehalococcoidia bacterium]|nr:DUF222 domain-containing protein [Dehalococcoidia bacterium]